MKLVTNLQWNLSQTYKVVMKVSTMVTELLMKLVTNLCKVGEEPFPAHSRHYWGRCLFSVKGGSQARPFPSVQSVRGIPYVPSFRSLFLFMKLVDDQLRLQSNQRCYDLKATLQTVNNGSNRCIDDDPWVQWTVPKTGPMLPLSEDFIHTWRMARTVHRFQCHRTPQL